MAAKQSPEAMLSPPASPPNNLGASGAIQNGMTAPVDSNTKMPPFPTAEPEEARLPTANGSLAQDTDVESITEDPRGGYGGSPVHPPFPLGLNNGGTYPSPPGSDAGSKTSRKSRGGRGQRRPRGGFAGEGRNWARNQPKQQGFYYPGPPGQQSFDKTFPPGPQSATWTIPYPGPAGWQMNGYAAQNTDARDATGMAGMQEHPVQVPVRVVNPHDLKGASEPKGGNLKLKLDLNLDAEITLKASFRGEVSLSLLND